MILFLILIKNKMNITMLNKNLVATVFSYCNIETIHNCLKLNTFLNNILNSDGFWINKIINEYSQYGHNFNIINKHNDIKWKHYYHYLYFFNIIEIKINYINISSVIHMILNDIRFDPGSRNNIYLKKLCSLILKTGLIYGEKIPHINLVKKMLKLKSVSNLIIKQSIKDYTQVAEVLLYDHILSQT